MRSFLCGMLTILIVVSAFSAPKKVVYLGWGSDDNILNVIKNAAFIETLPFDGVVIYSSLQSLVFKKTALSYTQIYDQTFMPYKGKFNKERYDFSCIYGVTDNGVYGDFFDDAYYNGVTNNWRMFARASKAAGLVGIAFDNEDYGSNMWKYPGPCATQSSTYSLQQYKDQVRLRGRQAMQACIEEFPNIIVFHYHGPYTEEKLPSWFITQGSQGGLGESYFVGMLEAAVGTQAKVVSGGEIYRLRTLKEFNMYYNWVKDTIASEKQNSPAIPTTLRPNWSKTISISWGVYTNSWPAGFTMNPTIMRSTLENALRNCDDFVWFYNESNGWLTPPGTPAQPWIPAVSGAKQAVNSGIYFTCSKEASVQTGGSFNFQITYDNFTGSAATLTYIKKPSWITAIAGNPTITGTAPNIPAFDTVVAVVSAAGKSDTTKLAITVSTYYIIETETGTLTAPMQIGKDPAASGGQYIIAPAGSGNTISPKIEATYSINVPTAGNYYVWLRIYKQTINPSGNYGTFVGSNGTFVKPGIANRNAGQYEWVMSMNTISLNAGANQIILGHGNEQVYIDKMIITNSYSAQLPASFTGLLPQDKKNPVQPKSNLSLRIMPDRAVSFLGATDGMRLSIRDILGRELGTYKTEKSEIIWNPNNGNSGPGNGVYFAVLKENKGINSAVKKFVLAR